MPLCTEVDQCLGLIDKVQSRVVSTGRQQENLDSRLLTQVNNDINTILSVLKNPVFRRMCKIQDTVTELGNTLSRHPSVTTSDFDITPEGNLILKVTPPVERSIRPSFESAKSGKGSSSMKSGGPPPSSEASQPAYVQEFERVLAKASQGRSLHSIRLFKTEGSSLGFSVVGLKSAEKGELGIFVQEIQPNGIAARDGSLRVSDQILAIDGQPLDSAITHQQAIGVLQQTRGEVEIVVARAQESATQFASEPAPVGAGGEPQAPPPPPPTQLPQQATVVKQPSEEKQDMVLSTEWAEVEVVELVNDGTGLGFGIIGGRSTGVVVKTILPGGVADRCGRLQSGDHILQIGDVHLVGMGSEQVAAVLRQCGNTVRLVVARPVEPSSPDLVNSPVPIVPTKILGDPEELERHLMQANGYHGELYSNGTGYELPEVEIVDVELRKDSHGLGITIAGYVCEKEELSGIFIKSISEGSAADLSRKIAINDRIVEVDGQPLQGYTNHQAVEVLRQTGHTVALKLERYHHGSKYDQLQSAISHSERVEKPPTPSSVSAVSLPQVPVDSDGESGEEAYEEQLQRTPRGSEMDLEDLEMLIDTRYEGEILPTVEAAINAKWSKIMGAGCEIVIAQLSKARDGGGLGISLEGTVDVEDGREVRPHHYIRSILADGPVGRSGRLLSGDELLEVNGRRLLGLNHVEVVSILKDLPMHVRLVCARRPGQPPPSRPIDTAQERGAFAGRNILGGSLQNLFQSSDRMVKAKSDGSLASTGTTETSLSKLKSRSLEPLSGLAMWSSEPHIIELVKGDRGLGFSILDYQDPMNPAETVIVIRSLVPGGVAQQDQRLIPGDRLLAVNDVGLENASLDQAVQALKGAPKGVVRIIVAKPLPLPDTTPTQSFDETPPPPLPSTPPPAQQPEAYKSVVELEEYQLTTLPPVPAPQPIQAPPPPVSAERLISTAPASAPPPPPPSLSPLPPLPSALDRTIRIKKAEDQLGVNVELADGGLNGLLVTGLANTGAIAADGRLQVGDYILALNGDSLRGRSPSEAKAILKRAQQGQGEISLSYIPYGDALVHKESTAHKALLEERERSPADGREEEPLKPAVTPQKQEPPPAPLPKPSQTSTLYINTTRTPTSVASAPLQPQQVQKRVVTHVTIFPSPPPATDQPKLERVTAKITTGPVPSRVQREDSMDDDSSSKQASKEDSASKSKDSSSDGLLAKHWGPERLVQVEKEQGKSLGISIVGGKVDLYGQEGSSAAISGIFIKNVLANSPAGRTGQLKTGDRILAVDAIDLRSASHERAVEVIRAAGNPVRFLVQSLVQWSGLSTEESETSKSEDTDTKSKSQAQSQSTATEESSKTTTTSSSSTTTTQTNKKEGESSSSSSSSSSAESEKITQKREGGEESEGCEEDPFREQKEAGEETALEVAEEEEDTPEPPPHPHSPPSSPEHFSSEEDDDLVTGCDLGRTINRNGIEIDRSSAAALRHSPSSPSPEIEDEFGYTSAKIERKWGELARKTTEQDGSQSNLVVVDLKRGPHGLGISLAGHKNRLKMAVFIVGLNPTGTAFASSQLRVGDEILEVNGRVLHARSHLNASALIKSLPQQHVKIIALRRSSAMNDLSVRPVVQFPARQEEEEDLKETLHYSPSRFPGLRLVNLHKQESAAGLGLMIMEGRHTELGKGIFVSDLQRGSVAEQAGLLVGDLILNVNGEELLGAEYEQAASVLKRAEGRVSMVVCNAAREMNGKPRIPPKPATLPTSAAGPQAAKTPSPSKLTSLLSTLRKSPSPGGTEVPSIETVLSTAAAPQRISPHGTMQRQQQDPTVCPIMPGKETTIEIVKDRGLGLSILGGVDTVLGSIIIQEVYPDGAAAKDGRLHPGDTLLYVNNEDFQNITHSRALAALRQTPTRLKMVVYREEVKEEDLYDVHEVELVKKYGKGLGLSIVARKNGKGVYISDVVAGGEAECDGRLVKGDRILSVNGKDLKEATQEEAASVLKTAMGSIQITVGRFRTKKLSTSGSGGQLAVAEEQGGGEDTTNGDSLPAPTLLDTSSDPSSPRTITLHRTADGLGFSIVGGYSSPHGNLPIYVKTVFERGAASGLLNRGDQILSVDDRDLDGLTHGEVVGVLKRVGDVVKLRVVS